MGFRRQGLIWVVILTGVIFSSCRYLSGDDDNVEDFQVRLDIKDSLFFSGDSAIWHVIWQVRMGPRVPGTSSHQRTASMLKNILSAYLDTAFIQEGEMKRFDGVKIPVYNIIGIRAPELTPRILLVAHWDTRPWRDQDPDSARWNIPLVGACDGASGTAVLLEIARVIHVRGESVPIDILLSDAEDQGPPSFLRSSYSSADKYWSLGIQYWVERPHRNLSDYKVAIVVDMVCDRHATFLREYYSEVYAGQFVTSIWRVGQLLGYSSMFLNLPGIPVVDDHLFLSKMGGIPAVIIIDTRLGTRTGFPEWWHTSLDTLSVVSSETLEAVGRTIEAWIYYVAWQVI